MSRDTAPRSVEIEVRLAQIEACLRARRSMRLPSPGFFEATASAAGALADKKQIQLLSIENDMAYLNERFLKLAEREYHPSGMLAEIYKAWDSLVVLDKDLIGIYKAVLDGGAEIEFKLISTSLTALTKKASEIEKDPAPTTNHERLLSIETIMRRLNERFLELDKRKNHPDLIKLVMVSMKTLRNSVDDLYESRSYPELLKGKALGESLSETEAALNELAVLAFNEEADLKEESVRSTPKPC